MFPRLIITLIVVLGVVALVRHLRARLAPPQKPALDAKTVACAHCQVYLPRDEAVFVGERAYCTQAHADADRP